MGYLLAGIALVAFGGLFWLMWSARAKRDPKGGPGRYPRDEPNGPGRRE